MAFLCWQIMEREIFFKEGQQKKSKNDSLCCKKKQVHEILTLFVKILQKALILFQQIWGECMISISKAVAAISSSPIHQVAKSSKDRTDRDTSLGNFYQFWDDCATGRKVISRNVKFPFVKIQSSNNADDKDSIPESNIWDHTLNWQVIIWEV